MTQDQHGQARDAGYGVRGDVIEDENDEYEDGQDKPMTRFQKVASALRGDSTNPDEPDVLPSGQGYPPTQPNAIVAAGGPDSRDALDAQEAGEGTAVDPSGAAETGPSARQGDYWDDSDTVVASEVEVVPVTTPDMPVADTDAANGYASNGSVPQQDQAGAATIPDLPVTQTAQDAAVTETPASAGRHAGAPAQELRPGEATDTLDNLGDLAYGKLLPDAADFTAQWQQIQSRFVDDPQSSVTEAAEVVEQVTAKLEAAIAERQQAIAERQQAIQERQRSLRGRWGEGAEADTETLRETLRMYRAFLDQLIGPKA